MSEKKGRTIGIDLGTTNSVVSYMEGSTPKIIENPEGNRTTPSVVAFKDGQIIVGEAAKRQSLTNPHTIMSIKRLMGTKNTKEINGKEYKPEEISAMILGHMREFAEKKIGGNITHAVITVPAYFNDDQRKATKNAGKIAGLEVERIINEPTAAALAYGLDRDSVKDERILVYDFGGGTFDVSILELSEGTFEVLATSGDNKLGGDDIDEVLMDYIVKKFQSQYGIDLTKDKMAMQRVKEISEKTKKDLSGILESTISLPFISASASGPIHFEMKIKRTEFEKLIKPLVQKTLKPLEQALSDAKLSPSDISQVLLVGGSTRIPMVKELIRKKMGRELSEKVNPDEAVSLGAAIQGGVLSGEVKDVVLLDVTPLTLGIETWGGVSTPLIERNTTIPVKKSQVFSTAHDNQPQVDINILQGERKVAKENKSLGKFILDGIKPDPKGVPEIEVTFKIDANGIVFVEAVDKKTNESKSITIEGSSSISEKEIDRMVADAEANKAQDKKRNEEVNVLYNAENLVQELEDSFANKEDKKWMIPDDYKEEIQETINELKELVEERNVDKLKTVIEQTIMTMSKFRVSNEETNNQQDDNEINDDVVEVEEHE